MLLVINQIARFFHYYSQAVAGIEISATADDFPEEQEVFEMVLEAPDGGAVLGVLNKRTVIIEKNYSPYGLLEIYPANNRCNVILYLKYL